MRQLAFACLLLSLSARPALGQAVNYSELTARVQRLYEQGSLSEAEKLAKDAASMAEADFGPKDPRFASALNDLAGILTDEQKYAEAEPIYRHALAIREAAFGPNRPEVATSLNNLAFLLSATGQYVEAEKLFERAKTIWSVTLPDHENLGTVLNNLGELYFRQEQYEKAEPLFKKSMAIRAKALGANHPQLAVSMNNLAFLYSATGRYEDAVKLYTRALQIIRNSKGNEHADVGTSLQNLAEAERELGHLKEAEKALREAVQIRRKTAAESPLLAVSLNSLAEVYITQGKASEALPLLEEIVTIEEKAGPEQANEFVSALQAYGDLLRSSGNSELSEMTYRRAMKASQAANVSKALKISCIEKLASLLLEEKKYGDAEPLFRRAVELHEADDGDNSLQIAAGLIFLARTLSARGNYEEAKNSLERSLALRQSILGNEHPEVGAVYGELGKLAELQKDGIAAEKYFLQDIRIAEHAYRAKPHPDIATAKFNLAQFYAEQGRGTEALKLLEEARTTAEQSLGKNHPFVQEIKARISELKQT